MWKKKCNFAITMKSLLTIFTALTICSFALSCTHAEVAPKGHGPFDTLVITTDSLPGEQTLPEGFVYLTDVIPDVLLDIRYFSEYNFVGTRIDGYERPVAICTKAAAEALSKVADNLRKKGYLLKIFDAYRPQRAVDHFFRWASDPVDQKMKQYFYPNMSKESIFKYGYVARKSAHTRGSTFDLTLFDMNLEQEVDMGGTFDFFGGVSAPDYKNITAKQHENRMLLQRAMIAGGFSPCRGEWWHFKLNNEPFPNKSFDFPVR